MGSDKPAPRTDPEGVEALVDELVDAAQEWCPQHDPKCNAKHRAREMEIRDALRASVQALREERDALRRTSIPHYEPADCGFYYDGCHCQEVLDAAGPSYAVRAEAAESRVRELEGALRSLADDVREQARERFESSPASWHTLVKIEDRLRRAIAASAPGEKP